MTKNIDILTNQKKHGNPRKALGKRKRKWEKLTSWVFEWRFRYASSYSYIA